MDRQTLIHWLEEHPQSVGRDPVALVDRCEREIRRHAIEDAWLAAKDYVERRERYWEHSWGFPRASEAYVARELYAQLSRELAKHEPHPHKGDEDHLVGAKLLERLDRPTRARLAEWALELAASEEHEAWQTIVRFTRRHAKTLAKQGMLSDDMSAESGNFAQKAAKIAHVLAEELEAHAHPRTKREH